MEDLVVAAAAGDEAAWAEIVERYSGLVWAIARGYGLNAADAADAHQTTWLRLVEHLSRIRDPSRIGGWIATTTRRECLRTLRRGGRQMPVGSGETLDAYLEPIDEEVDALLIQSEQSQALWDAFGQLSERCRRLLRVLMADPAPSYQDVSAALDMPVGSIGPTRSRCLEELRGIAKRKGI